MRRKTFRESDVLKAIRGAKAAGVEPGEVRVTSEGEIRILLRHHSQFASHSAREFQDEISKHFGNDRF